jgi:hypothetical protein
MILLLSKKELAIFPRSLQIPLSSWTKMINFLHSSGNVANLIIRHNIPAQSMVKSHLLIPQLLTI